MATISRGIKAPIIREGDDIVSIVCDCVLSHSSQTGANRPMNNAFTRQSLPRITSLMRLVA